MFDFKVLLIFLVLILVGVMGFMLRPVVSFASPELDWVSIIQYQLL